MIGLLQVPSLHQSTRLRNATMRLSVFWAIGLAVGMSNPSMAQRFDDRLLDRFGRNQFDLEEEPEEKPNLAERNNITANPLMTLEQEKAFEKTRRFDYPSALRTDNPNKSQEDTIIAGVRDLVYRLTMPENWHQIANLRRELVTNIDSERFSGDSRPRPRRIALEAAVKYLSELLSDQPDFVKLNAALLLGELNVKSFDVRDKLPSVPFAKSAEPLFEVLDSSDQPMSVKVVALRGLRRVLRDGKPARTMRDQIVQVLIEELESLTAESSLSEGQTWYLWRIIDALGMVDEPRSSTQQPLVVDALWETMLNETLPWHVRTHAARSLSQIDFDSSFDVGLIAHEIVKLAGTMTAQFNVQPRNPYWRECFFDIYFAFNPESQSEAERGWGLNQQVAGGSLRTHARLVNGAYTQVLSMVNGVVEHKPPRTVPGQTLQEAAEWLRDNQPAGQKLHPEAQSVEAIQKAHAPAEEDTAVSQQHGPKNGA